MRLSARYLGETFAIDSSGLRNAPAPVLFPRVSGNEIAIDSSR
jgi:hypothetical protein